MDERDPWLRPSASPLARSGLGSTVLAAELLSSGTLYDKVWDLHRVAELPGGSTQLFVGLHLIHEVTSPQAFSALKDKGLTVRCPERTVATVDHIVPTTSQQRPFADPLAEEMLSTLERNCQEHGIPLNNIGSGRQGIVHVIAPELSLIHI